MKDKLITTVSCAICAPPRDLHRGQTMARDIGRILRGHILIHHPDQIETTPTPAHFALSLPPSGPIKGWTAYYGGLPLVHITREESEADGD